MRSAAVGINGRYKPFTPKCLGQPFIPIHFIDLYVSKKRKWFCYMNGSQPPAEVVALDQAVVDDSHQMTVFTVNGQQIHARVEGPQEAPLAVLIHGWCSSWYTWKPLLPALSKRFRCLALDLPGYGSSPAAAAAPNAPD